MEQKPVMSLQKFVSHKRQMGQKLRSYDNSPAHDEMGASMRPLYRRVRTTKKQPGVKVELTFSAPMYVWNPMKSPSKLFTK